MLVLASVQRKIAPWLDALAESLNVVRLSTNVRRENEMLQKVLNLAPLCLTQVIKDVRFVEAGQCKAPVVTLQYGIVLLEAREIKDGLVKSAN